MKRGRKLLLHNKGKADRMCCAPGLLVSGNFAPAPGLLIRLSFAYCDPSKIFGRRLVVRNKTTATTVLNELLRFRSASTLSEVKLGACLVQKKTTVSQ
jgi:hypothetical protein